MPAGMAAEAIGGVMMAFEHSGLGHAARSTGWLYPLANLVHVLGAALVVGAIATFDIQVLRSVRGATIVSHTAIPIAIAGLLLQAASGVVLLSAEASTLVKNPAFQFKMAMLTFALANMAYFIGALAERSNLARRSTAPRPSPQCRLPAGYWCCWPAAASPICSASRGRIASIRWPRMRGSRRCFWSRHPSVKMTRPPRRQLQMRPCQWAMNMTSTREWICQEEPSRSLLSSSSPGSSYWA